MNRSIRTPTPGPHFKNKDFGLFLYDVFVPIRVSYFHLNEISMETIIIVILHRHHGILNHCQFYCLFISLLRLTTKKSKNPHHQSFVSGIPQGPIMWKLFPCQDIIMYLCSQFQKMKFAIPIHWLIVWGHRMLAHEIWIPHCRLSCDDPLRPQYWNRHLQSNSMSSLLTHLPLVPHICGSESGQNWFR